MFDRFIRLARARKALQDGRFEQAIQLADDPLIRGDRRADDVRKQARDGLQRRGDQRLQANEPMAAKRDFERALAAGDDPELKVRLERAEQQVARSQERNAQGMRAIDEARKLGEQGQLQAAEALAASVDAPELAASVQALRAFLASRRTAAQARLAAARQALAERQPRRGAEEFRAARSLDVATGEDALLDKLRDLVAADVVMNLRAALGRGDLAAAHMILREPVSLLPELWSHTGMAALASELATATVRALRASSAPETELALLTIGLAEPALPEPGPQLAAACRLLQRLPALRTAGQGSELTHCCEEAGRLLDSPTLRAAAAATAAAWSAAGEQLAKARALAAHGDLPGARRELQQVLAAWPLHDEARAEATAIDQGLRGREQQLQAARAAAKDGRLREAYGLLLAQAVAGPAGEDARLLANEIRARIDLVGRGLDQVRAAVHGRESSSVEGLKHCLSRLDELAKLQVDHEELPLLRAALTAELHGLEQLAAATAALGRQAGAEAATLLVAQIGRRGELLAPDRLDAKILAVADRVAAQADEALGGGRVAYARGLAAALTAAGALRTDLRERAERVIAAAEQQQQRAAALLVEARQQLAARDVAAAEERCEQARQLSTDDPEARKLEEEIRAIRTQSAQIDRIHELAAEGDFAAAHDHVGDMPPTPAMLRTRIFDMKQVLAKAQGLDGAFLLRVDEGGEFLVLRGESISIGNVRDGRADLPVLAAIAGRHARIQRSMSFHGGLQDSIVAEAGELRVGGAKVGDHKLRSGDRVQLGANLQLAYAQPSSRSLTASLQLLGGFQVAGTDRVLLLKDRGRDGRILIGPGKDVHVGVGSARGEVEVFAHKTGQIRVRCDEGGTIDGRPFKGEHPVDAGAMVQAAGMCFVLLPWSKAR